VNGIRPVVRCLLVCEDIVLDPANSRKVTLVGLTHAIRALEGFPLCQAELCVLVQLADARGTGHMRIEITEADTGRVVFRTRTRNTSFGNDPLEVVGVRFRIRNCTFPAAGLYWVQFWYNDELLEQQPLVLR
jgi:hypothetical protein